MNEFDIRKGREGRDAGMAQVIDHSPAFKQQFASYVEALPRGWLGTCEDIRRDWRGVKPGHHNAWGACWSAAKRRGLLVETNHQVHMTATTSHARKTHLYRRA